MSAFFPVTRAAIGSGQGKDERRQTGCLFFVQAESCGGTQITLSQKAGTLGCSFRHAWRSAGCALNPFGAGGTASGTHPPFLT